MLAKHALSQLSYTPTRGIIALPPIPQNDTELGIQPHELDSCFQSRPELPSVPCRLSLPLQALRGVSATVLSLRRSPLPRVFALSRASASPRRIRPGISFALSRQTVLPRKEVIQPHLPIRLPCYDFTPVIDLTFDGWLIAVTSPASGAPNSHGVTGGVYKARERIHRDMLIRDY